MDVVIDFRHPTPSHCEVRVFLNGGLTGTLTLRQDEIMGFQQILGAGCRSAVDTFRATGDPNYDPTPYCSGCGAMRKSDCNCGPLAENE